MRLQVLSLLLVATLFTACTSRNVMKLNDAIIKANDELRIASQSFNIQFQAVKDNNYTGLEAGRKKMVDLIDEKVKEISSLKADMPGGEDFKNAFIDYYKFEKDIYDTDYKEICLLTGNGDVGKITEIAEKMQGKAEREDAMEKNIHQEQVKFAQKNNLKLK